MQVSAVKRLQKRVRLSSIINIQTINIHIHIPFLATHSRKKKVRVGKVGCHAEYILSGNDSFFAASGVQLAQHDKDTFHFRRAAFYSHLKSKVVNILTKDFFVSITYSLGHPSQSHTSRLLSTSLSVGILFPRST